MSSFLSASTRSEIHGPQESVAGANTGTSSPRPPAAGHIPGVSGNPASEHALGKQTTEQQSADSGRPPHIAARAIEKTYRNGTTPVPVLQGVGVSVKHGEFLSIVGTSGSGKSTLLHLLGLLDSPDIGEVSLDGHRIDDLPARTRDQIRNRVFGFIFQFYHLLPELTLEENVLSPLMIRHSLWSYWRQRKQLRDRVRGIIKQVGLEHRLKHKPSKLSGGEMQRAAIARALVAEPQILLADEPTGNLDSGTGQEIMGLLANLNEQNGLTIIMVTHDDAIARQADRIVRLSEGRLDARLPAA